MSSPKVPSRMKAFLTNDRSTLGTLLHLATHFNLNHGTSVREIDVPRCEEDHVIVKVSAVAQNPTDYKHIDLLGVPNSIIGCDFAGTVVSVGSKAKGSWHPGDRIAGVVHGGHYPDHGAYAEYLKVDSDLAWRVPDSISDTVAATYGVSAVSAMQALLLILGLPWPDPENPRPKSKDSILIYSGATAASLFAIQLAKLAGLEVITTCSPRSNDLVRSYGADHIYDYRSSTALSSITTAHPDLRLAFDGFSAGASTKFCCDAVAQSHGKVVSLDPMAKSKNANVELVPMLMYTVFGRAFALLPPIGPKFPKKPEDRAGLARFYALLPRLLEKGLLKAPPIKENGKGLESLEKGIDALRKGDVAGQKLVVHL